MEKIYEMIMTMANRDFRVFPGLRQKLVMGSVFLLVFLFAGTQVSAAVTTNTTLAALQSAIDAASSNDVIVLADATYTDNFTLTIGKSGITVRPATLGGAYLNNIAAISISGNNITFSGFRFTSRAATNGTIITVSGDRNLLTQLNFNGYNAEKYINLQGRYNEVSYCNFQNKPVTAQIGNLIQISPDYSLPGYNKIRHCSFQNSTNGNECIRISDDATSTYVSRTIIEFNYFNNTGLGDAISVKCRENVLRYNTMTNNLQGDFCFKNGDNNIAYGNFFLNSGGIRVEKANNIYCYNNYFENCGDSVVTAPVKYVYVSPNLANINFIHNTFVGGTSIELTNSAAGNTWANNIFSNTSANIFMGSAAGIKWAGNQYSGTLDIPIASGMTRTNSLLVRNSDGYYGLSANSPAIQAASTNYPAILDIANVDDDPALTMDISGQSRPSLANLKDVGSVQFGTTGTLNRPLSTNDVGPVYLSGPRVSPSVSLTAPFAQQEFLAPASITLTAEASSAIGTVTNVSFYSGTNLLGTDTTAPYAYTWTGVPAGSYSLTARAMDNSGVVGTSTVAVITVLGAGITTNSFTTAGSADWTCPANVTSIVVECWGGGGAGGSAQRTSGTIAQYGGGGAGGAYVRSNVYKVVPDRKYYMNVGEGGFNNYIDNDSTVSGGDSWFDSSFAIIAKGGAGGESAIGSTTATGYGLGGTGTTSGSAAGGVVYAGGSGAAGASSGAGGGGSSAGTAANGTSATSNTGAAAPTGGGNGGTGPTINEAAGGKGSAPGGGGSGGMSSSSMLKAGGPGGSGWVVLTFVSNAAPIVSLTAPANGAGFFAPASIELTANASDADGVITNVSFYNSTGVVTTNVTTNVTTSVVTTNVTTNVVTTLLGTDTTPPSFAYAWTNVAAGSYSLTAQATDNSGLVRTSAVSVITVVNPTYTLTVNGGSGGGPYTNGTQVAIVAAPVSGKVFSQWAGDVAYVNNVTYTNATVTMANNPVNLTATFDKSILTVNSGTGGGAYTNGQRVAISASNINGRAFYRWTGDTSVLSSNTVNTMVIMPANPVSLTATYTNLPNYYSLTVTNGSGSGAYTNTQVVAISANPPAFEKAFYQWIGDTQYVNNVTYTNAQVTMSTKPVALTATYVDIQRALTVNGGTGGGFYTNGAQVTITATNPPGMVFDRWTGDTNVLSNVFVFGHIVTMSTNAVSLTAIFNDATNGVVNVNWAASGGFYYGADPSIGILGPSGSGQSTIAQLMYSPNNVKDGILPSGVGAVNDVVWDTITITENGNGVTDWAAFSFRSVVRAWTNGYVYALIFQDNNVQPGDWYYSTPLLALEKIATNGVAQNIEMNTDTMNGDPIDGTNGNQVIGPIVLTVNSGSGGGTYTNRQQVAISANPPAAAKVFYQWTGATQYVNNVTYTNALVTLSTNPVTLTAMYVDVYYALTVNRGSRPSTNSYTNGTQVAISATNITGMAFDQWTGDTSVLSSNTANTMVTMPANPVSLTATFTNLPGYYTLTVNNGSGSGPYLSGTKVPIAASDLRSGVTFYNWIGATQVVANVTAASTTATTTNTAITLTATYSYLLTVTNGSGSGSYTNTQVVEISAATNITGKAFSRWIGDTQIVNNVNYTNALVTLSTNPVSLTATYVDAYYALTINSGTGGGSYTNQTEVTIAANPPATGTAFDQWIGNTAALNALEMGINTESNAVTTQAYPITLTATYTNLPGYYALTVTNGTGSGSYTNTQVVEISATASAPWMTFYNWIGDTQVVNNVTYTNALVTMSTNAVSLTATYTNRPDWYALTVNSGSGSGRYTNSAVVQISASDTRPGVTFKAWIGDTQYVNNITYTNATVTMTNTAITLTATYYYILTVTNGTGSGSYTNTQVVEISAATNTTGKAFSQWIGDTNVLSSNTVNTTVTLSTNPVSLTATYSNLYYSLTVNGGSGGGSYIYGQQVTIAATNAPAGKVFAQWTGATPNLLSSNTASTTLTMPAETIGLTSTYKDQPYVLTVNSGTGSGSYTNGQHVAISAANITGRAFSQWIGDTSVLSGNTASTTVIMTNRAITLTATYTNLPGYYSLTVNSGSGSGPYTNTQVVAISASDTRPGVTFKAWLGDTQYVNNITYTNALVTMPAQDITLTATYYYTLTITNGTADAGPYTNMQVVAIAASNAPSGMIFNRWTGDTQVVASVTASNTTVTFSTNPVSLTATYTNLSGYYTLTVNSGGGSGVYSNGVQVVITANAPMNGTAFDRWTGSGTQVVASVTASNTTVTMTNRAITLTATYTNLPGYYTLTVTNGSGSGSYTNTQMVAISADAPAIGKAFSRWVGDTAYVANSNSASTTVTMSTNAVSLTATYSNLYYSLSVSSGGGTTNATYMQVVAIAADNRSSSGQAFDQWTGSGTQYVANVTASNTTVTMPAANISLRATFKASTYALTVNSGSGSGSYVNGQQVAITADAPAGTAFYQWTGSTNVLSSNTVSTTVTMPATNIALTATYSYILTVNSGSGSGFYTNGQHVTISATNITGKAFDQWIGDKNVLSSNMASTTVIMTNTAITLTATYTNLPGWYTLTVNNGNGSGPYTNTQIVAITAAAPATGKAFSHWIGDTQVVNNVTYTNATVTMTNKPVNLTATYVDVYYALTVNSGTGGGSYTNGRQVVITADAPASGMAFDQWAGDTAYVDNSNSASTTVTMPANAVSLNATYTVAMYTLTVNNGTGSGSYANGALVPISAVAPDGTAFDRWTGDTQAVASVSSLNTIVTMSTNPVTLTAACVDASNGFVSVTWSSFGFYFSADPSTGILGPGGSGKATIAQLMYSPDDVKDNILPSRAGAVNDVVLDTVVITESGNTEWATFGASTVRAWTNGYVYGLVFQDDNVEPGDWYFFSSPMLALEKKQVGDTPQNIRMTTDEANGDPIDGGPNNDQVINGLLLTGSAGANGAVSPASTNVVAGNSATFVITATNLYRIATLTTNGTAVTGMSFDNGSTTTNFTWSDVQFAGTLAATFTAQLTTNTPAGVPLPWLAGYFTTNDYNACALADQDGDGVKTWQEYIAGTDPNNAASCLKASQNTRNVITWIPVTGRVYSVYWSTNLLKGFAMKQDGILYPTNNYTNATPDSRLNHYQIKVRMQ